MSDAVMAMRSMSSPRAGARSSNKPANAVNQREPVMMASIRSATSDERGQTGIADRAQSQNWLIFEMIARRRHPCCPFNPRLRHVPWAADYGWYIGCAMPGRPYGRDE